MFQPIFCACSCQLAAAAFAALPFLASAALTRAFLIAYPSEVQPQPPRRRVQPPRNALSRRFLVSRQLGLQERSLSTRRVACSCHGNALSISTLVGRQLLIQERSLGHRVVASSTPFTQQPAAVDQIALCPVACTIRHIT
eukprot:361200-Chlamydomonas_euryale.AAC.25